MSRRRVDGAPGSCFIPHMRFSSRVRPWCSVVIALVAGCVGIQASLAEDNDYQLGRDSQYHPDVPHGLVLQQAFNPSTNSVFPGASRDYWVYVPKQYDGIKPAALMVFQDGGGYLGTNGQWRVPLVFDNLIARGEMPVTIGVFVDPGKVLPVTGSSALPRYNRSYEYDSMNDNYARFLIDELLPEVQGRYLITRDPNGRAIAGSSSGAIAAFTVAWHRPDVFRRVFSTIGTYVGLRGGNEYPTWIRHFEPKPLRVFLQDGYHDQNIYGGNWWVANQDMLSALQFSGYEVTNKWGTGGHDGRQGGSIFPEAMRWLWHGYPSEPVRAGVGSKSLASEVLAGDWELLGKGYQLPGALTANSKGQVFFADKDANKVYQIDVDGTVTQIRAESGGAQGLALLPDGTLIASQPEAKRIVAFDGNASEKFVALEVAAKEMTVDHHGRVYLAEPSSHSIKAMDAKGQVTTLDTGIEFPSSLCLSPDQSLLYVSDLVGQYVWSFQIAADGSLQHKQRYYHLFLSDDPRGSGADGLCVDTAGRLYVATTLGIQFCDQAGRVNGILDKPERDAWATDVCFGGRDFDYLYLTAGDKLWRRKLKAHGVLPSAEPVVPPAPRL